MTSEHGDQERTLAQELLADSDTTTTTSAAEAGLNRKPDPGGGERGTPSLVEGGKSEDARRRLGTEAIEQLASGLNLAAHTIEEFSQSTIDEESLKQLNDEQLFRLLEEAYHSKKLDEKNKSAIFKEILSDVHESLATPDSPNQTSNSNNSSSSKKNTNSNKMSLSSSMASSATSSPNKTSSKMATPSSGSSRNAVTYDSIAALTEIMDPSSHISIPASARPPQNQDLDDTSSNKTEQEEVDLDQFSDGEEAQNSGNASMDENGNPRLHNAGGGNLSYSTRQLRPLSIYRHNPAFHSQHVSVNQMDEIPSPLSPTTTTIPTSQGAGFGGGHRTASPSSNANRSGAEDAPVGGAAKLLNKRRKKKAEKADSKKAEEIAGYRGSEDIESLLQFIESKPKGHQDINNQNSSARDQSANNAKHDPEKKKRSRKAERHKNKRSRTPSINNKNNNSNASQPQLEKSKSPEPNNEARIASSQKTSRASSIARQDVEAAIVPDVTDISAEESVHDTAAFKSVTKSKSKSKNNRSRQAPGWLVDLNSKPEPHSKSNNGKTNNKSNSNTLTRLKQKPPSGPSSATSNSFNKSATPPNPHHTPTVPSSSMNNPPIKDNFVDNNSSGMKQFVRNKEKEASPVTNRFAPPRDPNSAPPSEGGITWAAVASGASTASATSVIKMSEHPPLSSGATSIDEPTDKDILSSSDQESLIVDKVAEPEPEVQNIDSTNNVCATKDSNDTTTTTTSSVSPPPPPQSVTAKNEATSYQSDDDELELDHQEQEQQEQPPSPPKKAVRPTPQYKDDSSQDVCFNYASILKFIKKEWDIVTMEISNGSNDIQSKVVYYKTREKI